MANAAPVLQQAHDLIEAGDYQAARQILDTVRSSNENNPDFWWVYAHAVDDATEGKAAIDRVRQLAPNYSGLETISGGSPQSSGGIKPLRPLAPPPPMGTTQDEDEFASTGKEAKPASPITPILVGMGLVLLIVVVLIVVLQGVFGGFGGATTTPEPTDIIDDFSTVVPTSDSQTVTTEEAPTQEAVETEEPTETEEIAETEEEPTETEEVVETEEPTATEEAVESEEPTETEEAVETEEPTETEEVVVTEEPAATDEALVEVMEELEDFGVPAEGIVEEESSLGESLSITTCTTPGPVANQNIIGILNAMRDAGVELQVEALVFHITDCSNDDVILSLGVSAAIVQSYWLGDTTASELLAALRRS